jgi:hypothetical protein
MKAKFILDAGEMLHMPLLTTFNYFLAEGFPEALSIGVVHALFKGGDAFEFDNYRDNYWAYPSKVVCYDH